MPLTTPEHHRDLAVEAVRSEQGRSGARARWRASTSRSRAAPSTACSAPTAPARPRRSACSPRCCAPTRAAPASSATTSSREADAVRRRVEPDRPVRLGRRGPHRPREPRPARPAARATRAGGARARADELLDAFGLADAAGRQVKQLLRRHAPPARHRGEHRRHARPAVPRRADDRPGPAQPQPGLGDRPRASSRTARRSLLTTQYLDEADQLADRIAVIDHGRVIAEGTRGELKASVGAGALHVRLLDPAQRERGRARCSPARSACRARSSATRPRSTARIPARDGGGDAGSASRTRSGRAVPRRHRASATSRSASPASTRCSSP